MEADIQGTQSPRPSGPKFTGNYAHALVGLTASRILNQEWFGASH